MTAFRRPWGDTPWGKTTEGAREAPRGRGRGPHRTLARAFPEVREGGDGGGLLEPGTASFPSCPRGRPVPDPRAGAASAPSPRSGPATRARGRPLPRGRLEGAAGQAMVVVALWLVGK